MVWSSIETIASVATAVSVILLLYQIVLNGRRATARFEDELVSEYRDIINELPLEALLGEELSDDRHYENLSDFYRYIDLSNEQIFLRQEGQIRKNTWENWRAGIKSNLSKPAFKRAWREIKRRSKHDSHEDFTELRTLENNFDSDPYLWNGDNNENGRDKQAKHNWRQFTSCISNLFWKFMWMVFVLPPAIFSWLQDLRNRDTT